MIPRDKKLNRYSRYTLINKTYNIREINKIPIITG
jgi:hypothetical protein